MIRSNKATLCHAVSARAGAKPATTVKSRKASAAKTTKVKTKPGKSSGATRKTSGSKVAKTPKPATDDQAAQRDTAAPTPTLPSLLTQPLGLEGWAALEPVILASLASTEPLLLIGRHGAAKSFLLERLAEALGLEFRCYNASLIDYDDLVGIPVPNKEGTGLHYISTPTAIWDAEVVFVDEISRTRPDLANKLFPIIHERRVQGIALEHLRHRWAAMNPIAPDDGEQDDDLSYLGVEPLDPALADRFTFLIEAPDWDELTNDEQTRLLVDQFRGKHPFPIDLGALVHDASRTFTQLCEQLPEHLTAYFLALGSVRKGAGLRPFSTRRMATLLRAALAVHAARVALARGADADPQDVDWKTSVWLAVRHGDPDLATVGHIDRARQLALHRQAWDLSGLEANDPWRTLLEIHDPIERVAHALRLRDGISPEDLGPLVIDALASEENQALRTATALALYLGCQKTHGLPAVVAETLGQVVGRVLIFVERTVTLRTIKSPHVNVAQEVKGIVDSMSTQGEQPVATRDRYARNLLRALLPEGYTDTTPTAVHALFLQLWVRFDLADPKTEVQS
jgi:MoxR-like ATPase